MLYREVLGLMQENVPNTLQSIQFHCFNGDSVTVNLWSDAYPETYFGFASMVKGFGDRERRGLKAVRKQWKKDVVMFLQTLIHIIKHFNTTINSKEFTTFLLR
jgi:hypothetical protein